MARVLAKKVETSTTLLEAAKKVVRQNGHSGLSTRDVATAAGVPLSQIHYHFGGKQGVILALLDHENQQLVERQVRMYGAETPLWKRYEQACDFLDDDLASGYVRVLQEMIAAGWSDPQVAARVSSMLEAWFFVLVQVATEAEERFGSLGPMRPSDVAGLIALSFLGGEAVILLGGETGEDGGWSNRVRGWLRSIGDLIRQFEES
jgi:AcrR family transcriptional regulator